MQPIPPSAFDDRLRALSQDALAAFVADVWAASGWETDVDGPTVVASRDGTTQRLLVIPAARLQRLRAAPETTGPVDLVVTPQPSADAGLPRGTPEAPIVSPEDLRNRLLYAIDADTGDRLAREYLDVPARSGDWGPREPAVLRGARRLQEATDPEDAPVSRRAALGTVGLSLVGGSAWVLAASRNGSDDSATGIDDDPGISGESVPDTASFAFEHTEDGVRVVHDGGEPIAAGQLLIRSQGLGVRPEVVWSEVAAVGPGAVVSEGDALVLPAADTYELTVLIDRDGTTEMLGEFRHGGLDEEEDGDRMEFARPPLASFSFEHDSDGRWLRVTHEEGDPIRAGELFVRGTGFLSSPEYRWDEQTRYDEDDPIAPGTGKTFFDVGDDAVAHVVWDDGSVVAPRVQATFVGADRPLDPSIDGVQSDRYGPANAGYATDVRGSLAGLRAAWRLTESSAYGQSVALGDGKAVIARSGGTVVAIDAADGAELWRARLSGGTGGTPTVAGGTVYLRQMGQAMVGICALDLADGSIQWSRELPHHKLGRPTVADGTVVVPASGDRGRGTGIVYAMSAAAGRSAWARDLGTLVVPISAAVGDGTAYVAPSTGVVAYDLESGRSQWRFEPDNPAGRFWWPMVAGETLIVFQFGADSDGVTALDRHDGSVRWQARVDGVGTLPVVGNGDVYVGLSGRGLQVLDREDGTERWLSDVGNPVQAMTASTDAVYVADENGTVHALSPEDGGSLFTVDTAGETVRSLAAHDDTLYLAGDAVTAYRVE